MLSDQGADLVMSAIEHLTEDVLYYDWGSPSANAMLNHLTELHRLRDAEIFHYVREAFIRDRNITGMVRFDEIAWPYKEPAHA